MEHVKNILVVEDQLLVALDIEKQLEASGYYPVNNAATYAQAIQKIDETQPDLILLDIILKDGPSGFRIAEVAREKNIPVIFVTASTQEDYFRKAKEYHPKAILHKPLDEAVLKETVEGVMK